MSYFNSNVFTISTSIFMSMNFLLTQKQLAKQQNVPRRKKNGGLMDAAILDHDVIAFVQPSTIQNT